MPSYAYIVIGIAVGFVFGLLINRHFSNKTISELSNKLSDTHLSYNAKFADEVAIRVAKEKQLLEDAFIEREHRIKENCRIENMRLKSEYDDELCTEMQRLEEYYASASAINSNKELARLKSENARLLKLKDADANQVDYLQNALDSVLHSWYHDYHKLNKRNEETIIARDSELERRRQIQHELLMKVHELTVVPEAKSMLCEALETATVPDLSRGAVYIKADLSSGKYHHADYCTGNLVLASKVFVDKAGFTPCTCCTFVPQPDCSDTVFRTSASSSTYHKQSCHCIKNSFAFNHVPLLLTDALRLGLKPCGHCNPPAEPTVKVFF